MDENRRKLSWIGLAGALVLLVMIGYPILKEKVREYRQRDISLAMEQSAEMAGEIEKEETRKRYGSLEEEEAFGLREQGKVCPEIQLTVLGNEGNGMEVTVPLWLSEEGIGYFFFPGFAEGKKLRLEQMEGKSLLIGEKEISQGDLISDISKEPR